MKPADLIEALERILPQTQCTQCGYGGCRPYAQAIASAHAPINRCPPGGAAGIERLAQLLARPALPLDPECGIEAPRQVARIVGTLCIGCTRCIQACPVDAIAGALKWQHAVIAELCTGCRLCLPPCPVDCIVMDPLPPDDAHWSSQDAEQARERHARRTRRLRRWRRDGDAQRALRVAARPEASAAPTAAPLDVANERKRRIVQQAIERARIRLQQAR
jgi:electron transport complex protein RnfB